MRCFLPCFRSSSSSSSSSKRQNHFHSINPAEEGPLEVEAAILIQPTHQNTAAQVQESIDWIAQSKIGKKEEESYSKAEVTITTDEVTKSILEDTEDVKKTASESERDKHEEEGEMCSESLFSLSLGSEGKPVSATEPEVNSPIPQVPTASCTGKEVPEQLQHQIAEEPSEKEAKVENTNIVVEKERPNLKEEKGEAGAMNHLVPKEYRYRDCSEEEEYDDEPRHIDSESEKKRGEEEKEYSSYSYSSSESLFSLSTDNNYNYRKGNSSAEIEKEVSSAMPTQSNNSPQVSSVLNPTENLSEGKMVRRPTVVQPSLENEKENINLVEEISLKMKKEMRVDSSFSSWLVASKEEESTPPLTKSNYSCEDRPILGALTAEEINKYSSTASSRRSRRSPTTPHGDDDTPIIGTVGSYWTHTSTGHKSKSVKNEKLNWSSTTVRTRLEPAAFQATTT